MLLFVGQAAQICAMMPILPICCGILYGLFVAAEVSEKCVRIPLLIREVPIGVWSDMSRQRVVDHIRDSASGLYVCGARLTIATVAKVMYVCSVAVLVAGARSWPTGWASSI